MNNSRRCRGFTLVEVIVAMTLLSLIMLGLLTALRSMAESSRRIDSVGQRIEQVRLVEDFLRRSIGQAQPLLQYTIEVGYKVYFDGDAQHMRWVAPATWQHGVGGLHVLDLSVDAQTGNLVLKYAPYSGFSKGVSPVIEAWDAHTLVESLGSVEFAYRQSPQHPWTPTWEGVNNLPSQVRVHIKLNDREWPDLIIAIRSSEKAV